MPHPSSNWDFRDALSFTLAAYHYWLSVFPAVRKEKHQLHRQASRVPDTELRTIARLNLRSEGKNLEGAAAFSAFLPDTHRLEAVRAQVAFQAVYDYVDSLAEARPSSPGNARQLHRALIVAVTPGIPHADYYRRHDTNRDGGYLPTLVDTCRCTLYALPSYPIIADVVRRNTGRIVGYQTRTTLTSTAGRLSLARWAHRETPHQSDLRWWETAAACGSSMAVLALFAAAADPSLTRAGAEAIEAVYWPWAGALHSLLDSLIDRAEDDAAGQHNLVSHYRSPGEMAGRLRLITTEAVRRAVAAGVEHRLIVTGMASLYLSAPQAMGPEARPTMRGVLAALGGYALPAMLMLRMRRLIEQSLSAKRLLP